jgi:hypothetical protein
LKAAVFVVAPVPPFAIAIAVPLQVPVVIVPTPVKLELVTVLFKVVPVKVPASAMMLEVLAAVNLPFESTVNVGIALLDP